MKSYTLKFKKADFISTANGLWRTPIVDLYDNSQYKNYTVRRSNYGTNLLGNGVYTGVDLKSPTSTEVGYVSGNRFIDTSSQVDILAWSLDVVNTSSNSSLAEPFITLSVYNAPESLPIEVVNPGTWANQRNIRNTGTIYMIDAQRFAYFELSIDPMGMSAAELDAFLNNFDITLYLRISIDSPTIDAFFPRTGHMLNMFPEWMDINETDPSDPSYLEMSTPESLGGKFINAIAGEWLTHLRSQIDYQQAQYYIDNVDISQKAWVYRSSEIPEFITSIIGDGIALAHTSGITEYHETLPEDHAFYWNKRTKEIFTNLRYNNLLVNGEKFSQEIYHIWNSIDDLGATVDLRRHRFEPNEDFRLRIKDVFINKPDVSLEGFKKAIRRELDLWQFYSASGQYIGDAATPATPNSFIAGATPSVLEMSDIEKDPLYFDSRGRPLQRFKDLVEELAVAYPMTWGYFKYDKAFWDPDGMRRLGFGYLPKTYDATPPTGEFIDSGVGDGNDLYLFHPDFKPAQIPFDTRLKIRGRQKQTRVEYQPIQFDIAVYGQADRTIYSNPEFAGWFTIEVTSGGVVYFSNVYVQTTSDVDITKATPTSVSRAIIEWANAGATPTGYTNAGYLFYKKSDGSIYGSASATPYNMIPLNTITQVVVRPGQYNPSMASPGYSNVPTQVNYRAWFEVSGENPSGPFLGFGGSASRIQKSLTNFTSPNIVFESRLTSSAATPDGFKTEPHYYTITLNNLSPATTSDDFVLNLPPIIFPSDTTNREIIVKNLTFSGTNYGALGTELAATPLFVLYALLKANGNNIWTGGNIKSFAPETTSITFSTGSDSSYPVSIPIWSVFEATMSNPITGAVDANGPWREGQRPPETNTNNVLQYMFDLDRNDFGIPNTTDYIVTWIGIGSTSSADVMTWIDTNTVIPAVTYDGETNIQTQFSTNAVVETLDGGVYKFSSFPLYARLNAQVNEKWQPNVHTGYFYDDEQEYYLYASPNTIMGSSTPFIIDGINRQGAPIIAFGRDVGSTVNHYDMRQVSNFVMDSNATPATPTYSLAHTEILEGDGSKYLHTAYDDIYNVTVKNLTLNNTTAATPVMNKTSSNEIVLSSETKKGHIYEVNYRVRKSYYVEQIDDNNKTKVVFDNQGYSTYGVTYETSLYNPATPIDIALNTLYTFIDEGFIYIDHDIRDLEEIEVRFSPSRIAADGSDYGLISVRTTDDIGNPKPFVKVNLFTNFGTLSLPSVTTDANGFAYATLTAELWDGLLSPSPSTPILPPPTQNNGYLGRVLGVVNGTVTNAFADFNIQIPSVKMFELMAVPTADAILVGGDSALSVIGKVRDGNLVPQRNALVVWRKGRYVYNVLTGVSPILVPANIGATPGTNRTSGYVVTDNTGRFVIEPFISSKDPGYWFVAMESSGYLSASPNYSATPFWSATPSAFAAIGDIVAWYEYPNVNAALDPITNLPLGNNQDATPYWELPNYTFGSKFPINYDESNKRGSISQASPQWIPPKWYAIDRYRQYQMGLRGSNYYDTSATPSHPDYREQ